MQPDDKSGLYQPGTDIPAPTGPQPVATHPGLGVDPAALQAALEEPRAPAPAQPISETATTEAPEEYDDTEEEYDDDNLPAEPAVTWVAHEYIHQEKGTTWFMLFAVVVVVLMAISIFVMGSWSFAVLLAVIAVVVVVYSRRPPRELTYSLSDDGLMVDDKLYSFSDFKSFGVIRDGEEFSVMLIPTQRFQPGITVYFPEDQGEAIVDVLGSRLPMKDLKLDAVDRIVRLLRL
jgi:hypothetical protein